VFESPVLGGQASVGLTGIYGRNATSLAGTLTGTITLPEWRASAISGGERHHGDLVGPPCQQLAQSGIADAALHLLAQMGAGAVDQQRAQGTISLFGDAARSMLAAGAPVRWRRATAIARPA